MVIYLITHRHVTARRSVIWIILCSARNVAPITLTLNKNVCCLLRFSSNMWALLTNISEIENVRTVSANQDNLRM